MKFVVVLYIDPQAGVERGFCIARCELFFVMFQIEIEWITGIHVHEDQSTSFMSSLLKRRRLFL
jgi:hypothetical protein